MEILFRLNPSILVSMEFEEDLDDDRVHKLQNQKLKSRVGIPKNILSHEFQYGYKLAKMIFYDVGV